MKPFQSVLLEIWREACRHIEIDRSAGTMAAILRRHVPLGALLIRRLDPQRGQVETIARWTADGDQTALTGAVSLSPAQAESLLAWWRQCDMAAAGRDGPWPAVLEPIASAAERDHLAVWAGPLGVEESHAGFLVLLAAPGETISERQAMLARVLLEPFSAAMENDRRLRETAALREAAEADNRSLLAKLGRKGLGDQIVGTGSGLRAVMDRVELVARSGAPVLIFGETGTGKELIARTIHARSERCDGPFIRVNCGAIPPELIDSQLFGHERGAFTGAVESRKGWFERADGGTLLLDEIGELPLPAQVRLLRVLQDGYLERVGGEQSMRVDVRIVAATHRDLAGMVASGRFREDLWYRVAVFPILLPPLRDRPQDIPALVRHFAQRAATRFGLPPVEPSPEDLQLLATYAWPGNIRELGTVIDRAAILGNGQRLDVGPALGVGTVPAAPIGCDDSPEVVRESPAVRAPSRMGARFPTLDEVIRRHIEAALTSTAGRVEGPRGAAALLGINPHTLRGRMRKLHVDWTQFRENP